MVSRETCIELLEQFIFDEDRIVTYKVLCQELDVQVNIAKQYLSDFSKIQKSKNISLQVTYFLAGVSEEDGKKVMKVVVVSEEKLEEIKKLLNVTSCHIYSISKSKVDKCSLLASEKQYTENREANKYFGIKHPTIETKPTVLKKVAVKTDVKSVSLNHVANSTKNGSSNKKASTEIQTKCSDAIKEKTSEDKEPEKESEKNKAPSKGQKSNPLASMWQKKEEKSKEAKSENSKPETKGKSKSPGNSKTVPVAKNSIMSMFSRQTAKNSETLKKEVSKQSETKAEINKVANLEAKIKDVPKEDQNNKEDKQIHVKVSSKRKSVSMSKKSSQKNKSKSESDDESEQPKKKKHRRICTFDDSDSESENEEAQDKAQCNLLEPENPAEPPNNRSSPMELTDDEEPIPPTPQDNTKGRKRIWKTVQKTFKDEDGFLITKQQKELVSASDSDDESPIPSKKKENIKTNLFSYKKQSSLTNFFKQS